MMKFLTSSGTINIAASTTSEVPVPSVMARFGTASTAWWPSATTSSAALMIKLA